ncbi:transcription elongation factor SPT5-like, partial [Poecile atricapillus]|uniref:transcription elongation factor SPT5-like n=1 Tax=Poecile atricapillus TaxID=48891 RepID=UPI00273A44D4
QPQPQPCGASPSPSPVGYSPMTPEPPPQGDPPITLFLSPQASPSPSPVGYSPMTPGAPSPGGYNPHTPGSGIEPSAGDWVTTDIQVKVRDSYLDSAAVGQTGVIRSVTDSEKVVSVSSEHLEPVTPTKSNKVKVILGRGPRGHRDPAEHRRRGRDRADGPGGAAQDPQPALPGEAAGGLRPLPTETPTQFPPLPPALGPPHPILTPFICACSDWLPLPWPRLPRAAIGRSLRPHWPTPP